jgi:thioesterase domain-containing protein
LKEIRQFQPEGPYYLGGFCLGGQVAYEMAQRLRQEGQKVALLAVIDTYNFHGVAVRMSFRQSLAHAGQKFTFHFLNLVRLGLKQQLRYLGQKIRGVYIRESGRVVTRILNLLRLRHNGMAVDNVKMEHINEEAHFAYIAAPYDGNTVMFKASKNYSHLHDPMLGWGGLISGPLEFIELPSNPGGLFMEPYVQVLAEKLKERIDGAIAQAAEAEEMKSGDETFAVKNRVVRGSQPQVLQPVFQSREESQADKTIRSAFDSEA